MSTPLKKQIPTDEVRPVRARLFMNGRSQAVRLPKEFRFAGNEVLVRRAGKAVVLEPAQTKNGWPADYWRELERLTTGLGEFALPDDPVPKPTRMP